MSKFKTFLIVFLSVMFLSISAVGCDMLQSGGTSSSSGNSEIIDGEEDWEGNWERPDTPIEDEPVIEKCSQECYVCGKCLNNYEETCTKDICSHEEGRTKYVFNATDDNVKREGGVVIEGDHLGGISCNPNVVITFKIKAAEDTVACLGATMSRMVDEHFITSSTPIYVNGERYYSRGCSKPGTTNWVEFHTVWLGCIELKAGENELKFTNVSSDGSQYNFKDFTLLSSVELTWAGERHQCESKNAEGYCMNYECNEYVCLNKAEPNWKELKIEGGDDRVLKYYINGKGEKQSLWNENEQVIGSIGFDLITGITGQTHIWAFEASEETYVRVSLNTSMVSPGTPFAEMYDITLNDVAIETGGKSGGMGSIGDPWTTFVDGTVAYVKISAGRNVLKFVHKYTNAGDNVKYMTLSYEKGTLTTVSAEEQAQVVPVTGVTLTAAGDKTSLAVNKTLQLTATVEPENATNKTVSYTSSDDSIATVNEFGLVTALKEGNVTITVTTSDGEKTASLDISIVEHICESKNAEGYCTNYECNEYVCLNKDETGWKQLKIEGGDDRVLKYYINGKGEKQSIWNENEQVIGSIGFDLITGITGQTHIWAFEASEETYVRVSLNTSITNPDTFFTDMYEITLNDVAIQTDGKSGNAEVVGSVWTTFADGTVAYVKASVGKNVLKFVHKYTNAGDNIKYMTLSYEKGTLTTVPVEDQIDQVTSVSVRTPMALLKTNETVSLIATVIPTFATNKTLTWTSANTAVATVDENGVVTAVAEGDVIITATSVDNSALSASVKLYVSNQEGVKYEAEHAQLTNCTIEPNGQFVGGINNAGAKVTFTVNSETERKVLLRINTSVVYDGHFSMENYFTIIVNGETIDESQGTFAANPPYNWNLDNGSYIIEVTLKEGANTIVLASKGTHVGTTLNYIAIY